VNTKLVGDVSAAMTEGMQARSLEHRLKIANQAAAEERQRAQSFEAQLRAKEKEMLAALQDAQDNEEHRAEEYEHEIKGLSSKLRISQARFPLIASLLELRNY